MGLLAVDQQEDVNLVLDITEAVASWWNQHKRAEWGFGICGVLERTQICCEKGHRLLGLDHFAENPSPFKRVAAFLVLGRLFPFIEFEFDSADGGFTDEERHAWTVRFMALMIAPALRKSIVDPGNANHVLKEWDEFPSLHYLLEFFAWLRWLDVEHYRTTLGIASSWESFSQERLVRMVMGCALMLEACYYVSEGTAAPDGLRTRAMNCLNSIDEDLRMDLYYNYLPPTESHQ